MDGWDRIDWGRIHVFVGIAIGGAVVGGEPFGGHVVRLAPWRDVETLLLQADPRRLGDDGDDLAEPIGGSNEDGRQGLKHYAVALGRPCDLEL